MGATAMRSAKPELSELVSDVAVQATRLVRQQLQLLQSEVQDDVRAAGAASTAMVAGVSLLAASGVLSTVGGVHLLQRLTRLPLRCCYWLVAGATSVAGRQLLRSGRDSTVALFNSGLSESAPELTENVH